MAGTAGTEVRTCIIFAVVLAVAILFAVLGKGTSLISLTLAFQVLSDSTGETKLGRENQSNFCFGTAASEMQIPLLKFTVLVS